MASFRTAGFNGYSVSFSPFEDNLLACAASQHFGIVGNGKLFIFAQGPDLRLLSSYGTQDAMYDCTWSEQNHDNIVTACGDGSVKLWDIKIQARPIRSYHEHSREVVGVHWNLVEKSTFLSASWDDTVKLWTPERQQSICTFREHHNCVYGAVWSPYHPTTFATAAGDGTVKVWDAKAPNASAITLSGHLNEVLSCDWNKYNPNILVSGSVDKSIRVWDVRQPQREMLCLTGHTFAVRRVKCSPFAENVIASCGYDITMRVWDLVQGKGVCLSVLDQIHTEFVVGLDWSLHAQNQIATCSWDENVLVFVPDCLKA
ncbi:peroxisomal targeting signal 2 receptor [Pelomyxa schiedti]|nr:peroxisomal targeting signal 2 receptor [Pelomyxa schiedti]